MSDWSDDEEALELAKAREKSANEQQSEAYV